MLDLTIDRLSLNITGAAGQEHRIRLIATRAAAILALRLEEAELPANPVATKQLSAPGVKLDLGHMTDEQASEKIAQSWIEVLALQTR